MSMEDLVEWDKHKPPEKVEKVTNLGWSCNYDTVGVLTGDNIYLHGTSYAVIKNSNVIHWHGISFSHMFETNSICVEPMEGGGVPPSSIEILYPSKNALIRNWDFIEAYENPYLLQDPILLQNIILKQEKSLDNYKNKYSKLNKVCYI